MALIIDMTFVTKLFLKEVSEVYLYGRPSSNCAPLQLIRVVNSVIAVLVLLSIFYTVYSIIVGKHIL